MSSSRPHEVCKQYRLVQGVGQGPQGGGQLTDRACRVSVICPTSEALAVDSRRFMHAVSMLRAARSVVWGRPETQRRPEGSEGEKGFVSWQRDLAVREK